MITSAFLSMLQSLLTWFISVRPAWNIAVPGPVSTLISFDRAYDGLLPITECLSAFTILLTGLTVVILMKWIIKVVDWVADVIP